MAPSYSGHSVAQVPSCQLGTLLSSCCLDARPPQYPVTTKQLAPAAYMPTVGHLNNTKHRQPYACHCLQTNQERDTAPRSTLDRVFHHPNLFLSQISVSPRHEVAPTMAPRKRHRPNPSVKAKPNLLPAAAVATVAQSQDSLPPSLSAHAPQPEGDTSLAQPMARHLPVHNNPQDKASNPLPHKQVISAHHP